MDAIHNRPLTGLILALLPLPWFSFEDHWDHGYSLLA